MLRAIRLIFLLSFMLTGTAFAQGDYDDVEIEATDLGGGIHMLKGAGDGVFLIDDQFAPLSEKIMAAIAELDDRHPQFVFNTHWHGDHTGGNENFGEAGSMLVSHANVRRRLSTEQFTAYWDRTTPAAPDGALPMVTFTDSLSFFYNDQEIVIFHEPTSSTRATWFSTHFIPTSMCRPVAASTE